MSLVINLLVSNVKGSSPKCLGIVDAGSAGSPSIYWFEGDDETQIKDEINPICTAKHQDFALKSYENSGLKTDLFSMLKDGSDFNLKHYISTMTSKIGQIHSTSSCKGNPVTVQVLATGHFRDEGVDVGALWQRFDDNLTQIKNVTIVPGTLPEHDEAYFHMAASRVCKGQTNKNKPAYTFKAAGFIAAGGSSLQGGLQVNVEDKMDGILLWPQGGKDSISAIMPPECESVGKKFDADLPTNCSKAVVDSVISSLPDGSLNFSKLDKNIDIEISGGGFTHTIQNAVYYYEFVRNWYKADKKKSPKSYAHDDDKSQADFLKLAKTLANPIDLHNSLSRDELLLLRQVVCSIGRIPSTRFPASAKAAGFNLDTAKADSNEMWYTTEDAESKNEKTVFWHEDGVYGDDKMGNAETSCFMMSYLIETLANAKGFDEKDNLTRKYTVQKRGWATGLLLQKFDPKSYLRISSTTTTTTTTTTKKKEDHTTGTSSSISTFVSAGTLAVMSAFAAML